MERFVRNEGGAVRSLLAQRGVSGRLEFYRHFREDLGPAMQRTKEMTAYTDHSARNVNLKYEGSVPRVMIHKWLMEQGKSWHDYATDGDLRDKFLSWFKGNRDFNRFHADSYRERNLSINRSKGGRTGRQVLSEWRQENATR